MRHSVVSEDDGWLDLSVSTSALAELADAGLVLELLVRREQLAAVNRLAARAPQLTIVVDHLGNPRGSAADLVEWARDIDTVAAHPNVFAKISGLGALAPTPRLAVTLLALEHFGAHRLMAGSDWPVSTLHGDYASACAGDDTAFGPLTESERADVLGDTARRVYGIAA